MQELLKKKKFPVPLLLQGLPLLRLDEVVQRSDLDEPSFSLHFEQHENARSEIEQVDVGKHQHKKVGA